VNADVRIEKLLLSGHHEDVSRPSWEIYIGFGKVTTQSIDRARIQEATPSTGQPVYSSFSLKPLPN